MPSFDDFSTPQEVIFLGRPVFGWEFLPQKVVVQDQGIPLPKGHDPGPFIQVLKRNCPGELVNHQVGFILHFLGKGLIFCCSWLKLHPQMVPAMLMEVAMMWFPYMCSPPYPRLFWRKILPLWRIKHIEQMSDSMTYPNETGVPSWELTYPFPSFVEDIYFNHIYFPVLSQWVPPLFDGFQPPGTEPRSRRAGFSDFWGMTKVDPVGRVHLWCFRRQDC